MKYIGIVVFGVAIIFALWARLSRPKDLLLIRALRDNDHGRRQAIDLRQIMQIGVSLVVLASALYIILSNRFAADQQKWAYGAVGTILGYWLKG